MLILKTYRNCNGAKTELENMIQKFVDNVTFRIKSNMDVAHILEQKCSNGDVRREAKYECDNFRLEKNDKNEYNLRYKEDIYSPDSFCFDSHENGKDLIAKLCIRQSRLDKYK